MLHYGSPSLIIDPNQWTILALRLRRLGARPLGAARWGGALVMIRYMVLSSSVFEYRKISYRWPRFVRDFCDM